MRAAPEACPSLAQPEIETALIDRLAALFVERLHVEVPSPDADLFETGILDSLQLVELLCQLEQQFGCRIAMDNLDLDDLRTLTGIAGLVAAHSATGDHPASAPSPGGAAEAARIRTWTTSR